jgi:hypothetical protein
MSVDRQHTSKNRFSVNTRTRTGLTIIHLTQSETNFYGVLCVDKGRVCKGRVCVWYEWLCVCAWACLGMDVFLVCGVSLFLPQHLESPCVGRSV